MRKQLLFVDDGVGARTSGSVVTTTSNRHKGSSTTTTGAAASSSTIGTAGGPTATAISTTFPQRQLQLE
eukprot:GSA25T00003355001.1